MENTNKKRFNYFLNRRLMVPMERTEEYSQFRNQYRLHIENLQHGFTSNFKLRVIDSSPNVFECSFLIEGCDGEITVDGPYILNNIVLAVYPFAIDIALNANMLDQYMFYLDHLHPEALKVFNKYFPNEKYLERKYASKYLSQMTATRGVEIEFHEIGVEGGSLILSCATYNGLCYPLDVIFVECSDERAHFEESE